MAFSLKFILTNMDFFLKPAEKKILIGLFAGVGLVIVFIIVQALFLTPKAPELPPVSMPLKPIKIDFAFLESAFVKGLILFEKVEPIEEFGRENPFSPY